MIDYKKGKRLKVSSIEESKRDLYGYIDIGDKVEILTVSEPCNVKGCLNSSHKDKCVFVKHLNSNRCMFTCYVSIE